MNSMVRPWSRRPRAEVVEEGEEGDGRVLRAVATVRPGQVAACSMSLLCAGVLLARGFIGLIPGRPAYAILGAVLAASALWGLTVDNVTLRVTRDRPGQVLQDEVNRSRRFGHPLTMLQVRCDDATGTKVAQQMRTTDRAWRRRGDLVIMLVETSADGARDLVARIVALMTASDVRMASFPVDALTVDALLDALRTAEPIVGPDQQVEGADVEVRGQEGDGKVRERGEARDGAADDVPASTGGLVPDATRTVRGVAS